MGVLLPLLDQVRLGTQALADHGVIEATRVRWRLHGRTGALPAPDLPSGAEAARLHVLRAATEGPPDRAGVVRLAARADALGPEGGPSEAVGEALDWATWELEYARRPAVLVIGTAIGELLLARALPSRPARMARLLATWMLTRAGYDWLGDFPLEAVLEPIRSRLALAYARLERRDGAAGLETWLEACLSAVAANAGRVREGLDAVGPRAPLPPLQEELLAMAKRQGRLTSGVARAVLGISRNTLKDNLRRLVELGHLERYGERRGAFYAPRSGGTEPAPRGARPRSGAGGGERR